jgi:ferritin
MQLLPGCASKQKESAMMKKEIQDALNAQINAEMYSSYLYMSMASWFENEGLKGFAHWMRVQALEELYHATKFAGYIHDRGGRVLLTAIAAPAVEWESPMDVLKSTLAHEVEVTARINAIMDLALKLSDHATVNLLNWFVGEQVEEEASVEDVIARLRLVENTNGGMFLLDGEMAARMPGTPPPGVTI